MFQVNQLGLHSYIERSKNGTRLLKGFFYIFRLPILIDDNLEGMNFEHVILCSLNLKKFILVLQRYNHLDQHRIFQSSFSN